MNGRGDGILRQKRLQKPSTAGSCHPGFFVLRWRSCLAMDLETARRSTRFPAEVVAFLSGITSSPFYSLFAFLIGFALRFSSVFYDKQR